MAGEPTSSRRRLFPTSPDWGDGGALQVAVPLAWAVVLRQGLLALHANPGAIPLAAAILPFLALGLGMMAAMVLVAGGIGWLVFHLARWFILWRTRAEAKEGATKTQTALIAVGIVFFGLPEIGDAARWWQEHVLSLIPHERGWLALVKAALKSNREALGGLGILALLGCIYFAGAYANFPGWLREKLALVTGIATPLLRRRNWWAAVGLVAVLIATAILAANNEPLRGTLLSLEILALFLWFLWPLIGPNLGPVIVAGAWTGPMIIANEKLGGGGWTFVLVLVLWSACLAGVTLKNPWRRLAGWVGTVAFLSYVAW